MDVSEAIKSEICRRMAEIERRLAVGDCDDQVACDEHREFLRYVLPLVGAHTAAEHIQADLHRIMAA